MGYINGGKASACGWRVRARCAAHLDHWIEDYLSGLSIRYEADGSTVLAGRFPDMPAVYGLILRLRDSGIELLHLHVEKIKYSHRTANSSCLFLGL